MGLVVHIVSTYIICQFATSPLCPCVFCSRLRFCVSRPFSPLILLISARSSLLNLGCSGASSNIDAKSSKLFFVMASLRFQYSRKVLVSMPVRQARFS